MKDYLSGGPFSPQPYITLEAEVRRLQSRAREAEEKAIRAGWDLDTANADIMRISAELARERQRRVAAEAQLSRQSEVCSEIAYIMQTYREQQASGRGVDTPGGLEHMGDVWNLFAKWDAAMKEAEKHG